MQAKGSPGENIYNTTNSQKKKKNSKSDENNKIHEKHKT
jgi:hypothetical protein